MAPKTILIILLITTTSILFGQSKYTGIYRFYNLPQSARIAGLGGNSIAIPDNDINFTTVNPSTMKDTMSNQFAMNVTTHLAGINYGNFTWGYSLKKSGNLALSLQYLSYGDFQRRDEFGYDQGTYGGNDYALNIVWSKELFKYIHIGAAFKPLFSKIDTYKSYGVAFDIGTHFYNPKYGTMVSIVVKNIGKQILPYTENATEDLPYDIQLGFSTKLKHAPFRFSWVFHTLDSYNLILSNNNVSEPNNTNLEPEPIEKDWVHENIENFLRHSIFGVEIIPTKAFYIQFGYNFQRRSELKTVSKPAFSGISVGLGVKIKKIDISYARSQYHLSNATNHISLRTNLNNLFR